MKKLEINLTDEQFVKLNEEIKGGTLLNIQEETFSGFSIKLSCIEGDISWLEFEMNKKIDIGEVSWNIK